MNKKRVKRVCNNEEEAIDHLFNADKRFTIIDNITVARTTNDEKITPDNFITRKSIEVLRMFGRYKRYGMAVLFDDMPNSIAAFFDLIQDVIDKHDRAVLTKVKHNGKSIRNRARVRSKD